MKTKWIKVVIIGAVLLLAAGCGKKEAEKKVIDATLIPSPTAAATPSETAQDAAVTEPPIEDFTVEVTNDDSLTDEQQRILDYFYDNFCGEDLGLPLDTMYYSAEISDEQFIIDSVACYMVKPLKVTGGTSEAAGEFYISLDGTKVFAFDAAANGYYILYDESEFDDEDAEDIVLDASGETEEMDEGAEAAMTQLRQYNAADLGLPANIDMQTCIIEYDGVDEIAEDEYYCFFISADDSFSRYYEYYVSIDYSSLMVYDENNNAYLDLYTGEYVQ